MLSSRTNAGITKNLKMLNEVNAVSFLAQLGQRQTCSNVSGRFADGLLFNKHGRGPEFHPISCFIYLSLFFLLCCLKWPQSVLSGSLDFLLLKVMLSTCSVVSLSVTTAFAPSKSWTVCLNSNFCPLFASLAAYTWIMD